MFQHEYDFISRPPSQGPTQDGQNQGQNPQTSQGKA